MQIGFVFGKGMSIKIIIDNDMLNIVNIYDSQVGLEDSSKNLKNYQKTRDMIENKQGLRKEKLVFLDRGEGTGKYLE